MSKERTRRQPLQEVILLFVCSAWNPKAQEGHSELKRQRFWYTFGSNQQLIFCLLKKLSLSPAGPLQDLIPTKKWRPSPPTQLRHSERGDLVSCLCPQLNSIARGWGESGATVTLL